jgi:GTP cyclohydrolase III
MWPTTPRPVEDRENAGMSQLAIPPRLEANVVDWLGKKCAAAQEGGEGAFNSVTNAELVALVSQLLAAYVSVNVGLEKYKEMHRQANNAALQATKALEELREKVDRDATSCKTSDSSQQSVIRSQ